MKVGDPADPAGLGAVISTAHRDKVEAYIDLALGAAMWPLAGPTNFGEPFSNGAFLEPTVITDWRSISNRHRRDIWPGGERSSIQRRGGGHRAGQRGEQAGRQRVDRGLESRSSSGRQADVGMSGSTHGSCATSACRSEASRLRCGPRGRPPQPRIFSEANVCVRLNSGRGQPIQKTAGGTQAAAILLVPSEGQVFFALVTAT